MSRAASPQTIPALAAGHSCQPLRNLRAIGAFSFVCVLSLVQAQRQIQNKKQPTVEGCFLFAEKVGFIMTPCLVVNCTKPCMLHYSSEATIWHLDFMWEMG